MSDKLTVWRKTSPEFFAYRVPASLAIPDWLLGVARRDRNALAVLDGTSFYASRAEVGDWIVGDIDCLNVNVYSDSEFRCLFTEESPQ